jgi:hypothetical protein
MRRIVAYGYLNRDIWTVWTLLRSLTFACSVYTRTDYLYLTKKRNFAYFMTSLRGLTVTLCERYRYVHIDMGIDSTPAQDFVQLYRAWASTLFTFTFDHYLVLTYPEYISIAFCYTVTHTLYHWHKNTKWFTFLWKLVCHGNDRNQAVGMLRAGTSVNDVALHFVCSRQTIHNLKTRYATIGSVKDRPRSGRPRATSRRDDRFIA